MHVSYSSSSFFTCRTALQMSFHEQFARTAWRLQTQIRPCVRPCPRSVEFRARFPSFARVRFSLFDAPSLGARKPRLKVNELARRNVAPRHATPRRVTPLGAARYALNSDVKFGARKGPFGMSDFARKCCGPADRSATPRRATPCDTV